MTTPAHPSSRHPFVAWLRFVAIGLLLPTIPVAIIGWATNMQEMILPILEGSALGVILPVVMHEAGHLAGAMVSGLHIRGGGLGVITLCLGVERNGGRLRLRPMLFPAVIADTAPVGRDNAWAIAGGPVASLAGALVVLFGFHVPVFDAAAWRATVEAMIACAHPDYLPWVACAILPYARLTTAAFFLITVCNIFPFWRSDGRLLLWALTNDPRLQLAP